MSVAYYDTLTQAKADANLSSHSDIFTFGLKVKNDGGGAHYKKDATASQTPNLGFQSAGSSPSFWRLVPDGGTVNPLQSEKTTDKERIQECIDFIRWWDETTTGTPTIGTITDYSSSRRGVKLIIPANRTFMVDTQAIGTADPEGLFLRGSITIEGENRQTSIIKLVEASTHSATSPDDGLDPVDGDDADYANLFQAENRDANNKPLLIRDIALRTAKACANGTRRQRSRGTVTVDAAVPAAQSRGPSRIFFGLP